MADFGLLILLHFLIAGIAGVYCHTQLFLSFYFIVVCKKQAMMNLILSVLTGYLNYRDGYKYALVKIKKSALRQYFKIEK